MPAHSECKLQSCIYLVQRFSSIMRGKAGRYNFQKSRLSWERSDSLTELNRRRDGNLCQALACTKTKQCCHSPMGWPREVIAASLHIKTSSNFPLWQHSPEMKICGSSVEQEKRNHPTRPETKPTLVDTNIP